MGLKLPYRDILYSNKVGAQSDLTDAELFQNVRKSPCFITQDQVTQQELFKIYFLLINSSSTLYKFHYNIIVIYFSLIIPKKSRYVFHSFMYRNKRLIPEIHLASSICFTNMKAKLNFNKFQITVVRFDPLHSTNKSEKANLYGPVTMLQLATRNTAFLLKHLFQNLSF